MPTLQYTVKVKERYLLELPVEAQELELTPGEEVQISINRKETRSPIQPNEGMLAALHEIAERQKGRRHTDGSDTLRVLREARAGAMYGYDPVE